MKLQKFVTSVGRAAFGDKSMSHEQERVMRFFEEACELVRAAGMTEEQASQMLAWEYNNRGEPGHLPQEVAGTGTTLYGLADAMGYDLETLVEHEGLRVLANIDKVRVKAAAKPAFTHAIDGVI